MRSGEKEIRKCMRKGTVVAVLGSMLVLTAEIGALCIGYNCSIIKEVPILAICCAFFIAGLTLMCFRRFMIKHYFTEKNSKHLIPRVCVSEDKELSEHLAYHEAGHTAISLRYGFRVDLITNTRVVNSFRCLMSKEEIKKVTKMKLAGYAAEKLFFGEAYSGASGTGNSDFQTASEYIEQYVCLYDDSVGFLGHDAKFNEACAKLEREWYAELEEEIKEEKEMIKLIGDEIVKKRIIPGKELLEIVGQNSERKKDKKCVLGTRDK